MKEKLQEIYNGLTERLKSPFLLTFMVVWAIHNWEFVYGFMTFNSGMSYNERLTILKEYLKDHNYNELLWFPLGWAFISICLYYFATFISEGISLLYNKWIRSWLYLKLDTNKLKTIEAYNLSEESKKHFQAAFTESKKNEEEALLKVKSIESEMKNLRDDHHVIMKEVLGEKNNAVSLFEKSNISTLNNQKRINILLELIEKSMLKADEEEIRIKDLADFNNWVKNNSKGLIEKYKATSIMIKPKPIKSNEQRFRELFSGTWINMYVLSDDKSGNEPFRLGIHNGEMAFLTHDKSILLISDIKFFETGGNLYFTKTNIKTPDSPMHNILTLNNNYSIYGTENGNIKVDYRKVSPY